MSIGQNLLDNQFVSSTNDTCFFWYSKYGGANAGLKFIFHIKYEKGRTFNLFLTTLDLNTELFYDDESNHTFHALISSGGAKILLIKQNPSLPPG